MPPSSPPTRHDSCSCLFVVTLGKQVMISRVESDLDVTPNVRPVCGPTWHHCVTSRLVLSEKDDKLELSLTKNPSRPMRIMRVCVNEMGMEAAST